MTAVETLMQAEIERLREQNASQSVHIIAQGGEIEGLREDAERYRWLRDMARTVDWTQYIKDTAYVCHCRIGPQGMDAAIDAARKGEA